MGGLAPAMIDRNTLSLSSDLSGNHKNSNSAYSNNNSIGNSLTIQSNHNNRQLTPPEANLFANQNIMMHRPNSTFQSNLPAMSQSLSVTNHHMYSNPSMVTINHSHQSSLLQHQQQQQQEQQQQQHMQQQAAIHQAQLHQRANLQ